MNKELIDRVWACLSRELKEEVKKEYKVCSEGYRVVSAGAEKWRLLECCRELEDLFGYHNLTSDAEEEEMLMVSRSAVIAEMNKLHKYSYQIPDLQLGLNALTALFGTKCLPDELNKNNNGIT